MTAEQISAPVGDYAIVVNPKDNVAVVKEVMAEAEINKHREFQFWAEQTVSL